MRINFVGEPSSSYGYSPKSREIEGSLSATRFASDAAWIEIRFTTNPGGQNKSRYSAAIAPDRFPELCSELVRVDPKAALKAFAEAMQQIDFPEPERKVTKTVAAPTEERSDDAAIQLRA